MVQSTVALRPAGSGDLEYVATLLERNGLPSADVDGKPDCFYVATDGDRRVGVGGIEQVGTDGLLRSVVVEASVRGQGYGAGLTAALTGAAGRAGVETLYLLTTTAAGFFADRGFEPIDRDDAPASIRETSEFADLCPDSATCMRRPL